MVPSDRGDAESGRCPARIWVVAGAPGAGKSTVADVLLELHREAGRPVPALMDKDTLYADFVDATLQAAGRRRDEREGSWYDEHIKRHEYAGMTAAAKEISASGCSVLLCAPFTEQIRQPGRWQQWGEALGGGPISLVYVRCDPQTLLARLGSRAARRDGGKRSDINAFLARVTPEVPPPVPHLLVDNGGGATPIEGQVRALFAGGN